MAADCRDHPAPTAAVRSDEIGCSALPSAQTRQHQQQVDPLFAHPKPAKFSISSAGELKGKGLDRGDGLSRGEALACGRGQVQGKVDMFREF